MKSSNGLPSNEIDIENSHNAAAVSERDPTSANAPALSRNLQRRTREVSKPDGDDDDGTHQQRLIEMNAEAQLVREVFRKIAHKLLRSPSGESSHIGLDIFPEEEEQEYQVDLDMKRQSVQDGLDQLAPANDGTSNTNNNSNVNNVSEGALHHAYRTAARSFRPKARCFASKSMKHYLENGEADVKQQDGEATAQSSGRVIDPETISDHVGDNGRLLCMGPPSVGKTRFALMTTKNQPFLSRPAVYLPLDYVFSSKSSDIRTLHEALAVFFDDLSIPHDEASQVVSIICNEYRPFPVVWIFDNLEILVNRDPAALSKIEVGTADSDVATLDRDAFVFFARDGMQREQFFARFENITEWRIFRWNLQEEKGFIWSAVGESHPFVSTITATVLRAFESHPQLALLRGCPLTTHILALLAMRGSSLRSVKCLSEAFELLIHLIIANESKIKNALGSISKEARKMVSHEITHLSFDARDYAQQDWFHSLVGSGLLAVVKREQAPALPTTVAVADADGASHYDDGISNAKRVAFRNRFIAELFAHLNLFQTADEGKEPHSWSWASLKWDRADRVLWTLVAGRVASRAAQGNPRELFAFHAASQFFLCYNAYRSSHGSAVIHDPSKAPQNRNVVMCYLVVELSHYLGATLLIDEILKQHGFYARPPSHLRWMVPLCGRFGASETLAFLLEKLRTRGSPQPLSTSEMADLYVEAVLGGQRPSFFAELAEKVDVSFDLRQSAQFGAISPLVYAIHDARRTRQANSPAFLKRVRVCLAEAESRGDRDIMNALLGALPIAEALVKQFFQVGDAALACMEARKKLWIHYAQLWHAHPAMPWESVGCFATETLELQYFDADRFREEVVVVASSSAAGTDQQQQQQQKPRLSALLAADEQIGVFAVSNNYNNGNNDDDDATFRHHHQQQQQQQQVAAPSFTSTRKMFTIRCSPVTAHQYFSSSKITLIEGAPFVGKTTFGLQLCMIQPFPDHVCVYFDLRSLMLLTREHRDKQEAMFGKKAGASAGATKDKKDRTSRITSFFTRHKKSTDDSTRNEGGANNNNNNNNDNTNNNNNKNSSGFNEFQLPSTLQEFWKMIHLPIDERAPIMWVFDNCGRLSKEVDACVLNLLTEIASSAANRASNEGEQRFGNDNGNGGASGDNNNNNNSIVPPSLFSPHDSPLQFGGGGGSSSSSSSSASSPRGQDRAILLSRILRGGAKYLAKDVVFSNMKTWTMPARSAEQEATIIYNYLLRAANLSLHLARQGDGGFHVPPPPGAAMLTNDSIASSVQQQCPAKFVVLDLDPQSTCNQIVDNLYQSRLLRQQQIQTRFNDMVSAVNDPNFALTAPSFVRGSGMVLKWICRLTAMQGNSRIVPNTCDPLSVIEQEMRRRCSAAGITNPGEQLGLIQTTCVAALRAVGAGFPFPVQRDESPATDEVSGDELQKMLMCDFVHAAPDLKRQECEFRASEVELFAALSLRIVASASRRHLALLSWKGEFEAVWNLAAASLSNEEFAAVCSDCLDKALPAKTTGVRSPPPFIPFFLLLEVSDHQPFLVSRALEIATNLREADLAKKVGLSSLCGLFGSLNVLRDHLVVLREAVDYAAFDQGRLESVVSACSYFSKEQLSDLVSMLNELHRQHGGVTMKDSNGANGANARQRQDSIFVPSQQFGGSDDALDWNVSFAPHVLKKYLTNSSIVGAGSGDFATTNSSLLSLPSLDNNNNGNNNNNIFIQNPQQRPAPLAVAFNIEDDNSSAMSKASPASKTNLFQVTSPVLGANAQSVQQQQQQEKKKPLDKILKKDFRFIKHPNGFFASKSNKIVRIIDDYDPATDRDVPYLLWIDEDDQSKKTKSKFFGIKKIVSDASDPKIFVLELPERSVKLEAKNEADAKLWKEQVQEYISSESQ